ncbi:MAG: hypothetical protein FWB71_01210 [Defluviitaleaceae bacterium]|nr:hypothetical protein [Defluviitaleaceae bacterium]
MHDNQKPEADDYRRDIRFDKVEAPPKIAGARRPSRLILFLLMWLPGLGHMYMGLMRRGLFFFSMLPLLIYLTVLAAGTLPLLNVFLGFGIAGLYIISFFEALKLRRDMVAGIETPDALPDLGGIIRNKTIMGIVVLIVGISVLHALITAVPVIAPLAIILIICAIWGRKKKKNDSGDNQ